MLFKKIFNALEADYGDKSRYQNLSTPDGYRRSEDMFRCSNCDFSMRSHNEGANWYCQKHQVDVSEWGVCDHYHTAIF